MNYILVQSKVKIFIGVTDTLYEFENLFSFFILKVSYVKKILIKKEDCNFQNQFNI